MNRDEIIRFTREAGGFDITPEFLDRFAALVAAAEREACAKVCDIYALANSESDIMADAFNHCSAAIRARGAT